MHTDTQMLDHLSHSVKFYLELDEPDGVVQLKDGQWEVCRRAGMTNHYPIIGRFPTLREALSLAITPMSSSERQDLVNEKRTAGGCMKPLFRYRTSSPLDGFKLPPGVVWGRDPNEEGVIFTSRWLSKDEEQARGLTPIYDTVPGDPSMKGVAECNARQSEFLRRDPR